MKKRILKACIAAVLTGIISLSPIYTGFVAADSVVSGYTSILEKLRTARKLVDLDVEGQGVSISMMLQQVIEDLGSRSVAVTFVRNAKALVDTGTSDASGVGALIDAAIALLEKDLEDAEGTGEQTEEETIPEEIAAEETAPQETTTQEEVPEETTPEETTPQETTPEETTPEETTPEETTPEETTTEEETTTQEETTTEEETEPAFEEVINRPQSGLPEFQQDRFNWAVMNNRVSLKVPSDWGNNKSDSAITNYSPANKSGAITPSSGTLQTTYYEFSSSDTEAFEEYEDGISKLNETSGFSAQDTRAAGLDARRLQYTMTLGANQFNCEIVCFTYNDTMYAVQMLQGNKRAYDFYTVFDTSVNSIVLEVKEPEPEPEPETTEAPEPETTREPEPETTREPEPEPETTREPEQETTGEPEQETTREPSSSGGTLESFTYTLNGHRYQFPTRMSDIAAADLPIPRNDTVAYEITPDSQYEGIFSELANTSYYFFDGTLTSELAGVSNLYGYDIPVSQGILTDLIDLKGGSVNMTLPGGVSVGSPESAVINAFPQFANLPGDGSAYVLGDEEFIYGSNTRSDGTFGYLIIKNDKPYYSSLSIICENGYVREICLECIGNIRADGIFLY